MIFLSFTGIIVLSLIAGYLFLEYRLYTSKTNLKQTTLLRPVCKCGCKDGLLFECKGKVSLPVSVNVEKPLQIEFTKQETIEYNEAEIILEPVYKNGQKIYS